MKLFDTGFRLMTTKNISKYDIQIEYTLAKKKHLKKQKKALLVKILFGSNDF